MICPALQITENVLKQYLWYVLCGSSFSRTCPFGFGMFVVCIHVGGTNVHAIPTECLEGPLCSQSRIGSCRGQRWIDTRIEKLWADVEEKKAYKTIDISVVAHGRNQHDQTFAKFGNGTSQIVFVLHSPHMAANIRPWEKVKCSGGPCQKLRWKFATNMFPTARVYLPTHFPRIVSTG